MARSLSGRLAMLLLALFLTLATAGAFAPAPASPHLTLHHAGRRLMLTPRGARPLRASAPATAPLVPGARLQWQCALVRDGSPSRTCSGEHSAGRGVGIGLGLRRWGLAPLRSKADAEEQKPGSEEALTEQRRLKEEEANAGDAAAEAKLSEAEVAPTPSPPVNRIPNP